jgi:hypothetical protein
MPAAILMEHAGRIDLLRSPRRGPEPLTVGRRVIYLRDQITLHRGNARLTKECRFEDFVEYLNRRIFFWPGWNSGPISYGLRHFAHYRDEDPIILRVAFESLLRANPSAIPLFCRYNSGSPRCSYGKKSPRGPNTFVEAGRFAEAPSKVVEVTFDTKIVLPGDTEFAARPTGPWDDLL